MKFSQRHTHTHQHKRGLRQRQWWQRQVFWRQKISKKSKLLIDRNLLSLKLLSTQILFRRKRITMFKVRVTILEQRLVHYPQKSLYITFYSYSLFSSTNKTICVTHFIFTLTVKTCLRVRIWLRVNIHAFQLRHLNFKYWTSFGES